MPWFTSPAWNKWSWSWVSTRHDVCCQVVPKPLLRQHVEQRSTVNNLKHSDSWCLIQSIFPLEEEECLSLSFNYLRQHVASPPSPTIRGFYCSPLGLGGEIALRPISIGQIFPTPGNTYWEIEGNHWRANCCHVSSSDTLGLSTVARWFRWSRACINRSNGVFQQWKSSNHVLSTKTHIWRPAQWKMTQMNFDQGNLWCA